MADTKVNAYYSRKLAEELKWYAAKSRYENYDLISKKLWDAYEALLEMAEYEENKADVVNK